MRLTPRQQDGRTDGTPTLSLVSLRCYSTWGLGHTSSEARSQIAKSDYVRRHVFPSVRIKQLEDFSGWGEGGGGWKSTEKIQVWLKSNKNSMHFTLGTRNIYDCFGY